MVSEIRDERVRSVLRQAAVQQRKRLDEQFAELTDRFFPASGTGLAERRSGHVIMLLGSLVALAMPVMHLRRARGVADALARPDASFFVWILLALAVTGLFSAVLAVRGLVNLQRSRPR